MLNGKFKNKTKGTGGFTNIEFILFGAVAVLIILWSYPTFKTITEDTQQVKKQRIICDIEMGKGRFDQDAPIKDKRKFDNGSDAERFNKIAPLIGVSDPVIYTSGSGINRIKVNKLGEDVTVE